MLKSGCFGAVGAGWFLRPMIRDASIILGSPAVAVPVRGRVVGCTAVNPGRRAGLHRLPVQPSLLLQTRCDPNLIDGVVFANRAPVDGGLDPARTSLVSHVGLSVTTRGAEL